MTEIEKRRLEQLNELLRPIPNEDAGTYEERKRAALQKLVAFFSGMAEAERRGLAPEVAHLHRSALKREVFFSEDSDGTLDPRHTAIALAATATLAELERAGWWELNVSAYDALVARRPGWLHESIELGLDQISSGFGIGKVTHHINRLVASGQVPQPQHAHYAIGIAYGYVFPNDDRPLVDRVRHDLPRIEPAIWRQFEVEGGGEISLANFDKYMAKKSGGTWADVLILLAREGHLDRQRLLDASLDALDRGFAQFRAGWFARFHESLGPTPDERASRTGRYLDLLASPLGPTVSLAMAALKRLQKAGKLDTGSVLERIEPALFAKAAVTAKSALALLAHAAKSASERRSEIARVAAIGLEHPSSEVQADALKLLETCAPALNPAAREAIEQRIEVMSPALRARAAALFGSTTATAATAQPDTDAKDIPALKAAAKRLPGDLRRLAGVDAALDALARGLGDVPRALFTGMEIPRLDPAKAIAAITTFEELIDEALAAIEHPRDLNRVERVLAGAVRFAADRPANAAELLAPLAKSLKRYGEPDTDATTPRDALHIVMSAFFDKKASAYRPAEGDPRAVMVFRTAAMAHAIRSRATCIQFSTPTHQGCWIDPRVLVGRSVDAAREDAPWILGIADQILALLRLAPDHRPEALQATRGIGGEWGAALRYALGGDTIPGNKPSLWVAAARARAPFDEDARLRGFVGPGTRGADLPPRLTPSVSYQRLGEKHTLAVVAVARAEDDAGGLAFAKDFPRLEWDERKARRAQQEHCCTTVDLADPPRLAILDTYFDTSTFLRSGTWILALWPQHPEPVFALAALGACMIDGNNYERPGNEPLADGLKLILDPDVPLGPMAYFMLCRGLNAIDAAAAQATLDALIATIDDGRLDGETLGEAMHAFLMTGLVFGKRWPVRLKEVARSSVLGRQVVRRALQRAMYPGTPLRELRDVHSWIETLHELSIEAGEAIEDPLAREGLARFGAGGKAGKTAQALLNLASADAGTHRTAAAVHAVHQRLTRAGRWVASNPTLGSAAAPGQGQGGQ